MLLRYWCCVVQHARLPRAAVIVGIVAVIVGIAAVIVGIVAGFVRICAAVVGIVAVPIDEKTRWFYEDAMKHRRQHRWQFFSI